MLIEAEIPLQLVQSQSQQSLHREWWEEERGGGGLAARLPPVIVDLDTVVDGHGRVLVAHIHPTPWVRTHSFYTRLLSILNSSLTNDSGSRSRAAPSRECGDQNSTELGPVLVVDVIGPLYMHR